MKESDFSIDEFTERAHSGEVADESRLLQWINGFEHIIIWGAGNLGSAVDDYLTKSQVKVSAFWDARWEELKAKNGKPILETFSGNYDTDTTLVIFCITNVPVSPKLLAELNKRGWKNIKGQDILEGIICPFSKDNILDTSVCNRWEICTLCSCQRLSSIMKYKTALKKNISENKVLSLDRIHFIVNNKCNLRCTHCFMYMNTYANTQKRNVDIEIMRRDIEMLLNAIDSLGVINVFGGEPFLHPDLGEIIKSILEYDNYGSVIVNTNGLVKMQESQTEPLKDGRIRLAFSNYLTNISDTQAEMFQKNVHSSIEKGIVVGVQNKLPTWNISSTLCKNDCSSDELKEYKERCGVKFLYVHNGRVYPCAMCLSINDLDIEDYKGDYIEISECKNSDELKERIIEMINKDYYETCAHCDQNLGTTVGAGEQGFIERYAMPK